MRKSPEVNWSAIVRRSIMEKAQQLSLKEKLLKDLKKEKDFIDWSVDLGKRAKKWRLRSLNGTDNR